MVLSRAKLLDEEYPIDCDATDVEYFFIRELDARFRSVIEVDRESSYQSYNQRQIPQEEINFFKQLLDENPDGIPSLKLISLYEQKFGHQLNLQNWGFRNLCDFIFNNPDIFAIQNFDENTAKLFPDYPTDYIIRDPVTFKTPIKFSSQLKLNTFRLVIEFNNRNLELPVRHFVHYYRSYYEDFSFQLEESLVRPLFEIMLAEFPIEIDGQLDLLDKLPSPEKKLSQVSIVPVNEPETELSPVPTEPEKKSSQFFIEPEKKLSSVFIEPEKKITPFSIKPEEASLVSIELEKTLPPVSIELEKKIMPFSIEPEKTLLPVPIEPEKTLPVPIEPEKTLLPVHIEPEKTLSPVPIEPEKNSVDKNMDELWLKFDRQKSESDLPQIDFTFKKLEELKVIHRDKSNKSAKALEILNVDGPLVNIKSQRSFFVWKKKIVDAGNGQYLIGLCGRKDLPPDSCLPGSSFVNFTFPYGTETLGTKGHYLLKVTIVAVASPRAVFMHTPDASGKQFHQFSQDMNTFYNSLPYNGAEYFVPEWFHYQSFPCVACVKPEAIGFEREWERSKIVGVDGDIVIVESVDFAGQRRVKQSDLRLLSNKFHVLPTQSIRAQIMGIAQRTSNKELWKKASIRIGNFSLPNYELDCAFFDRGLLNSGVKSGDYEIILFDRNDPDIDICINDILVVEGYTKYDENKSRYEELRSVCTAALLKENH